MFYSVRRYHTTDVTRISALPRVEKANGTRNHDLSVVRHSEVDHLRQLQIVDVVAYVQASRVRLQGGLHVEGIVRQPTGPLPESVFCKVRREPGKYVNVGIQLRHLKTDVPLGQGIISTPVNVGLFGFGSLEQLRDEIALGAKLHAVPMCGVAFQSIESHDLY